MTMPVVSCPISLALRSALHWFHCQGISSRSVCPGWMFERGLFSDRWYANRPVKTARTGSSVRERRYTFGMARRGVEGIGIGENVIWVMLQRKGRLGEDERDGVITSPE